MVALKKPLFLQLPHQVLQVKPKQRLHQGNLPKASMLPSLRSGQDYDASMVVTTKFHFLVRC
jgi:hypothetical protein